MHGGKNWGAVAALVPGRTRIQCNKRWHDDLTRSIDRTTGRTGIWTEDEIVKLKDAVQTHGGKDWIAIATLVPGRTKLQCHSRWHTGLALGRTGKWSEEEDSKLKDAVQLHGGKDWVVIAALVPGRTRSQCYKRWHDFLDSSIDQANRLMGKWAEDEDSKLKVAVQAHGVKNWAAIATLIPGRTKIQCAYRWHSDLVYSTDGTTGRTGTWTEDELIILKDSVQTNGGKNWVAIAALVPGRTSIQCTKRWHMARCLGSQHRQDGRTNK
jgi:myb proto-oncogene protein